MVYKFPAMLFRPRTYFVMWKTQCWK